MLQLINNSPFEPSMAVFPDPQGIDTLYIVIKATFELGHTLSIADKQVKPVMADEYWGDPQSSSLRFPADMHLLKPFTDVVLISRAWPPNGQPVPQLDVRFTVAERQKVLRIFGNRHWADGSVSSPQPFESMPIVYEYAFGGCYEVEDGGGTLLGEGRNPVGRGFRGKRKDRDMEGLPLPNIEDPRCLISESGDNAQPAGFAAIAPSWQPRRDFAGTYDEAWQTRRAPYLPEDFDSRFFNMAHPDFVFNRYLVGGEPVVLGNLNRDGPLNFLVPECHLQASVRVAGNVETPPLNLETVLIEPENRRLCMTWRGALSCDKKALKIEQVTIDILNLQLQQGVH